MKSLIAWLLLGSIIFASWNFYRVVFYQEDKRDLYLRQFENNDVVPRGIRVVNSFEHNTVNIAAGVWFIGLAVLTGRFLFMRLDRRCSALLLLLTVVFSNVGCVYRPYEPVKLEAIGTNEEGFLIPWTGDSTKQVSTENEDFLRKNLVMTKQVRIPQQWIETDYTRWYTAWQSSSANGHYQDGAVLIKVDKAPVTREWTADENSGTSNKKEAVWVMTADQVEFSTGWTATARIASRDDAIKFLHNYPNGTLTEVMDREVRAQIQTRFGMEVTDLPMDELRKNSTPHMRKIIEEVEKFFLTRGITITNLGITGGFVYKNSTIQEKLVEVFNAEQEKNIAQAKAQAQEQFNKKVSLEAEGLAKATITKAKAEADAIKAVADAKSYELSKAKEDLSTYLTLKRLEVETKKVEKWSGEFPRTFMGGTNPGMLLSVPIEKDEAKK